MKYKFEIKDGLGKDLPSHDCKVIIDSINFNQVSVLSGPSIVTLSKADLLQSVLHDINHYLSKMESTYSNK